MIRNRTTDDFVLIYSTRYKLSLNCIEQVVEASLAKLLKNVQLVRVMELSSASNNSDQA